MSLVEYKFMELNRVAQQATAARAVLKSYEQRHPDETSHYYKTLEELASTEDPDRRAQLVEDLSNLDNRNLVEFKADSIEEKAYRLKKSIVRILNADHPDRRIS